MVRGRSDGSLPASENTFVCSASGRIRKSSEVGSSANAGPEKATRNAPAAATIGNTICSNLPTDFLAPTNLPYQSKYRAQQGVPTSLNGMHLGTALDRMPEDLLSWETRSRRRMHWHTRSGIRAIMTMPDSTALNDRMINKGVGNMKKIGLSVLAIGIAVVAVAFFSGGNAFAQGYLTQPGIQVPMGIVQSPGVAADLGGFRTPVMGPDYGRMPSTVGPQNYGGLTLNGITSGHHVDWHRHQGW
jgi:hypothetical protein